MNIVEATRIYWSERNLFGAGPFLLPGNDYDRMRIDNLIQYERGIVYRVVRRCAPRIDPRVWISLYVHYKALRKLGAKQDKNSSCNVDDSVF